MLCNVWILIKFNRILLRIYVTGEIVSLCSLVKIYNMSSMYHKEKSLYQL